jgi:hypothetical protein
MPENAPSRPPNEFIGRDIKRMPHRAEVATGISTFAINFCEFHFFVRLFIKK